MALFIRLIIRLFQLVFFSRNRIFLSQQISQQCFSAGLSAQPNGSYAVTFYVYFFQVQVIFADMFYLFNSWDANENGSIFCD
jgi:hypothetical protein